AYGVRHDTLGMMLWREMMEAEALSGGWFGPSSEDLMDGLRYWARAMTGHHGQPPRESDSSLAPHFSSPIDQRAALGFAQEMRSMFLTDVDFEHPCFADPSAFLRHSQELSW